MASETTGARRGEAMVRKRGEPLLTGEPVGIFAGVKGPRCSCYEGSLGCLGPPCVTERPPEAIDARRRYDQILTAEEFGDFPEVTP